MNYEIIIVMLILGGAVLLFITEWIRVDVVALLVLVGLTLTGVVTPFEALSGFSNMSVITVWAMLILSAALTKSGVAQYVGGKVFKIAGSDQLRLVLVIMITAGLLSGIMNNIAVAAFMLPVVIDMSNRTRIPASKLLIPLAFACLMGGLTTLIGTPSNILVSESLFEYGLQPFKMFDYTPAGAAVLAAGTVFVVLIGYKLLPTRNILSGSRKTEDISSSELFSIEERIFIIDVEPGSPLLGVRLADSRLSALFGINVIAINRAGETILAPPSNEILVVGDQLIVSGRQDEIEKIQGKDQFIVGESGLSVQRIVSDEVHLAELEITAGSPFCDQTIAAVNFRRRYGVNVLALDHGGVIIKSNLHSRQLVDGDKILLQGSKDDFAKIEDAAGAVLKEISVADVHRIDDHLLAIQVPPESKLIGEDLKSSRLGDAFGLTVLGIQREGSGMLVPKPDEVIREEDTLLVEGDPDEINSLIGFRDISFNNLEGYKLEDLEDEQVGFVEVILSPRTTMNGKTLRQVRFREKFGVTVTAIWREGVQYRSNLRDFKLRYGDAMLLYGSREKFKYIGEEQDFIVLTAAAYDAPQTSKLITAVAIMGLVLIPVVAGWLPIAISALLGVVLMVLFGCLTMEEAYRSIDWRAVFLIAGLIPLGIALESSGAAQMLAESVVSIVGGYGPLAIMAGLFIMAAVLAQIIPNPAVALLVAPIAYNTAVNTGISPYPLMMAVAVAASAAFLSPVGHPANLLVMGPGGYKISDFIKAGVPVLLVVFIVAMIIVPLVWSF